jgi:hypothetical protein
MKTIKIVTKQNRKVVKSGSKSNKTVKLHAHSNKKSRSKRISKSYSGTHTYKTLRQKAKAHKKRKEERRYISHIESHGKDPLTYKPKEIYLKQILLTPNIKSAVKTIKPDISEQLLSGFYTEKGEDNTFPLGRMENMMSIHPKKFDRLLKYEPLDIEPHLVNGKKTGIKIEGEVSKLPVYHLVNGRHRLVRSIIEGRAKINTYEQNK